MTAESKPIILYTSSTPNGRIPAVLLEELKAAYGLDYDVNAIQLSQGTQKQPWYLALNPNGKIPLIVDRTRTSDEYPQGFPISETSAILLYLSQNFDKEAKFWWKNEDDPEMHSQMIQWVLWTHGGLNPMQMQASHFTSSAPADLPYAQKKFQNEVKRLYGVLESRLQNRDWLVGRERGKYSIADINAACWVRGHKFSGVESLDEWPAVKAWLARQQERPAFKAGVAVP